MRGIVAAAFLLVSHLVIADGTQVLEPAPLTGAYTAHFVADRDHVSIIEISGNYNEKLDNGTSNVEPREVVAREFFRTHPDDYDFVVAFSTFEYNTGEATAFHWGVQNKVKGIGIPQFDNTDAFGSHSKLQGFIDMAALTRYVTDPLNPDFEKVMSTLAHEMLHQWAAHVHFKDASGNLSDALLGRDGAHWSFLLNSNASVEYGNLWKDNGDGTFTSTGQRTFYSPLDLYLMGFYKPEEVPPFYLIENPSIDKSTLPQENVTISGTKRWVTINDIIAAEGAREPSADNAQKEFRIAFILLTGPGENVSDAQIAALNNVRNAYMTRFAVLSGGRGVAEVYPEAMPDVTAGSPTEVSGDALRTDPASLDAGLAWLRNQQQPDGEWLDKSTTDVRDTTITLQALTKLDPLFTKAGSVISWLSDHPSKNTDYLARYAYVLADIGGDASALRSALISRQNSDGGFGIAPGYKSDPLDTALALQALATGSEANATQLDNAVQYLLGKQNSDGGFSPADGGPSRTSVTTTVLNALKAVNKQATVAPAALTFLAAKQNPDGGFGDSPSTVHDTANVLQTFMAFGSLDQIRSDNAADFLLSRQTVSGSWDGSVYSTASALMALKRFKYPNWAVTSVVATPTSVNDGDRVQLTVHLRNDSSMTAPQGVLRIYDGDPAQGGVAVGNDITVPSMAAGTELTFSPLWDSFNKAGAHTLYAVVDPDKTQTEMSERDNSGSVAVTVLSAPSGIDLTFGDPGISVNPVQPNRLPTTLSISLNVRNLGLTDVQNAHISLWDGVPGSGTLVGETTLDVLSRSTVVANFSYVLTHSGTTVFTAVVDPDNAIVEVNETNNTISADITTAPSVDLVVQNGDITADKAQAVVGSDITFHVKIRNEGTSDAPSTDVRYLVTDGTKTEEIRTNSIQLGAGASTEQTVTWRADMAGNLTFTTQLDPSDLLPELDESNNVATFNFASGQPSGINLAVSYQDFTFTPNPGHEGYPELLSVVVRNTGTQTATNAEVAFYNGDPASGGVYLGSQIIDSLAGGASTTVSFTWPAIPDNGDKLPYVIVDPTNAITEFSEDDNVAFNMLPILSLPDLAISDGDITLTPLFPKAGDNVSISVRVANLGAQEANNVVVRLYDGDPASGGVLIGEKSIDQIAGFGTSYVAIDWKPVEAKLYPLVVQVDPDNAILERIKSNNSVHRDVLIQDGNLNVTQKYFSPNGDGVKDSTQLFFRVQGTGTARVNIINKRDKEVRHFTVPITANGTGASITWDGLDDLGRLVEDGTYRMRVIDTSGATFGEVIVYLDTNRSSLLEAAGTKYESYTNLTCELPDVNGFTMTSDDSKVFFSITGTSPLAPPPAPGSAEAIYPRGIYSMAGDGTEVQPIVPNTWASFQNFAPSDVLASGNGSRILFGINTAPESYWVADGDGRNLTPLNYAITSQSKVSPWYISQDGSNVFLLDYNSQSAESQLFAIPSGGVGIPHVVLTQSGEPASDNSTGREMEPNDETLLLTGYDTVYGPYDYYYTTPKYTQKVTSVNGEIKINGSIGNPGGDPVWDIDYYSFTANAGDNITITSSLGTGIVLYKPDPSSSPYDIYYMTRMINPYGAPSISKTLPITGTYVVAITPSALSTVRYIYNNGAFDSYGYARANNVAYTLDISGLSSSAGSSGLSSNNQAFSPDEKKVALLTLDSSLSSSFRIGDLQTGTSTSPLVSGVEISDIGDMQWSPNSKHLAVSRSATNQVVVFDRNGNLERQFFLQDFDDASSGLVIKELSWASSGSELAFEAYTQSAGGIYIADVITGTIEKVASFKSGSSDSGFASSGYLNWVPGERSLIYRDTVQHTNTAILLDENNTQKPLFGDWGDFDQFSFSPTGRQMLFTSSRATKDATSTCYNKGATDYWSYKSLLNLTADLRAIRSATAGGIQLKGTAADANFAKYQLDYAPVETPDVWHPIAPPVNEMVLDGLFTTWVPPGPGNYFVRLSVEDLAGNVRQTIKRVSWSDSPSITDVYRAPAVISPNGDGNNDNAIIHYRVLEPVHLTFEFFNDKGTRVRVMNRDYSSYGIDADLLWDGRDDSGLVVPDGRYRMTVQNYEFFITVDNSPPVASIQIRDAYQSRKIPDPSNPAGPSQLVVAVDPGIVWSAQDVNLDTNTIESGLGADPFAWSEQLLNATCTLAQTTEDPAPMCNRLPISDFVGHRFRITAADTAGNRTVSETALPSEQLIVYGFGNLKKAPCGSDTQIPDCTTNDNYFRLSTVPYVPMTDADGGSMINTVDLNTVRFGVAETIGHPIAQLFVQYRPATESVWRESVLNQFVINNGSNGDYDKLATTDVLADQYVMPVWDMAGVDGGRPYVVRLHAVDTSGQEYFSNTFRVYTDGLVFLGNDSSSIPSDLSSKLLSENPPSKDDYPLWGKEYIGDAIDKVRLIISSNDDVRYAVPQEVGVIDNPDTAFFFPVKDLQSCKTYTGYLEATTVPKLDPATGEMVFKTYHSNTRTIKMPCLALGVKTEVVPATTCGEPSKNQTIVKFAPASLDGKTLKLLTLSQPLPDNAGDDVLFNVNYPDSTTLPAPPAAPNYNYSYTLDTSQYPEGVVTLTAKLLNVDDEETVVSVPVLIDHTPPVANLTYPLEGQRICGVPLQMADGSIRNTLTLEGQMSDAGGFDYTLELGEGTSPTQFTKFHDSRTLDSFKLDPTISPAKSPNQLFNVAGPIGQIHDLNGDFTVHLSVTDAGGFKRCDTRTFYFDGVVEGARSSLDRHLFSPNGDGQFDQVVLSYGAEEAVTVDVDVYHATSNGSGGYSIIGDNILNLQHQVSLLSGDNQVNWDGRDANGNVVADGWYGLVVTIKDGCGNTKTLNNFVEVDSSAPSVSIAYPLSTDQLPLMVEIQGAVNDPHLFNYVVAVASADAPDAWISLAAKTSNTQGTQILATWNNYGLTGDYIIRVLATDTVGNQTDVEVPVTLVERANLIGYLEAVPALFSPNGDGKLESTGIRFGLEENGIVTLTILDSSGAVKKTLYSEQTINSGPVSLSWDGSDDNGNVLPDGHYTASLLVASAANPLLHQEEKVTVILDKTAPQIDISRPSNGFISANGSIIGTIQDANIASYDVSITNQPENPVWMSIGSDSSNRTNAVLGNVNDQEEGSYALKVQATDLGETTSTKIIPFIIDRTPPKVTITAPAANIIVGKSKSPINISAVIDESYFAKYELNVGNSISPASWTTLASGTTLPLPESVYAWDISAVNDGVYTLQLTGEDKAGNTGESRTTITIDNTGPSAVITSPADGSYVKGPQNVSGTAADTNFAQYTLEIAPGAKDSATQWNTLNVGAQAITDGTLLSWESLPPDGVYTLRLTVQDRAENVTTTTAQITVDTHPPTAPLNLVAAVENKTNARLTWEASTDIDLAGYAVYRDGVRINTDLITDLTYLDANLIEGRYVYTVKAFDRAGWESTASNEAVVVLDTTPPTTHISLPTTDTTVSGLVDIKGTAYSTDDFKEYRLYVAKGLAPTDYQLVVRSPVPVLADNLSQWNTLVLEEGADYTLKLEAEDINGNIGVDQVSVKIDNLPPAAPTGLAATVSNSDTTLTWNANTEPDLLGYLLFRNDKLANQSGVLVGSLKPYALLTTNYADLSLADGSYTYYLLAIDKAGNISDPSTAIEINVDTHAPHVVIAQPADNTSFDNPLYVLGTSPDTDIATVQFQYRAAGSSAWIDLGPADSSLPYATTFDPTALNLQHGYYQLQAVATDKTNHTDPAPSLITVQYRDVTPPSASRDLTSHVNGGDITLTWTANTEPDLAGYYVDRRNYNGISVRLTSTPVTQSTYTDTSVADGTYYYTVTAVDSTGNSADPSNVSQAIVYRPVLSQPYTPTTDNMTTISGKGLGAAIVSGEVSASNASTFVTPVSSNSDGTFTTQVALAEGDNAISIKMTDSYGNVSKPAVVNVTSVQPPVKPTGLSANVTGYNVALSWNANPETNVIGYRVFRDGTALLPDVPATGLTATASSTAYEYYYGASKSVDSNQNTYWAPSIGDVMPSAGQWLAVNLTEPKIVTSVKLLWSDANHRAVDFDIEAWTGSTWLTIAEVSGNADAETDVKFVKPYLTQQLRLVLRRIYLPESTYSLELSEFEVFTQSLEPAPASADVASDGHPVYTVSAVNSYGIEGGQSEPLTVPVGDVTPPDPVILSTSVTGSDVSLSWQPSTAIDLARYTVYRDGALIATVDDVAATQYIDSSLPNGTYTYVVKAIDTHNNESAPSNEAPATVAVAPPSAPINLTVVNVPSGGALQLTWQPGDGQPIVGYRLFRSTTASGAYELIGTVSDTQYVDSGLVNGNSYYYVVAALDALGNISANSIEASGIPMDLVAPDVAITFPVTSGISYQTTNPRVTISGLTEAGANVSVLRNGTLSGSVSASAKMVTNTAQLVVPSFITPLSPDGRYLAIAQDGSIVLYDYTTGTSSNVATLQYLGKPSLNWSADGTMLLFTDIDASTRMNVIRAYKLSDATSTTIAANSTFTNVYGGIISRDGMKLAVLADKDSIYGLWSYDLSTSTAVLVRQLDRIYSDIDIDTIGWSPNSRAIAYAVIAPYSRFGGASSKIEIANIQSGTVIPLGQDAVAIKPSWSSDSNELLYTASSSGISQVWRYRISDNLAEVITQGTDTHTGPHWLPDNSAFTCVENDSRVISHRMADGAESSFVEESGLDGKYTEWVNAGYFAVRTTTGVERISPAGRFELRSIALETGDNLFTAIATDTSGNHSSPSKPVVINYVMGDRPDLALSTPDIRVLPSPIVLGNSATVSVTIHNIGTLSSTTAKLTVIAIDTDGHGQTVMDNTLVSAMAPQGSFTVSADWTPTLAGTYQIVATVDPMNEITESNESNNFAIADAVVAGEAAPAVSVTLDRTTIGPNDVLSGNATLTNSGDNVSGTLVLSVEDDAGYLVQTLSSSPVTIGYGQTQTYTINWPAGSTFAGVYHLSAKLVGTQGGLLAQDSKPFTLSSQSIFAAQVSTDKATYGANSDVLITGSATYQTGNVIVSGVRMHLLVSDANGQLVGEKSLNLGDLMPGAENQITMSWNSGLSVGVYTVQFRLESLDSVLAQSQSSFTILSSGPILKGSMSLSDASPAPGTPQQVTYSVDNVGNGAALAQPIRVALIDADNKLITSQTQSFDLAPGVHASATIAFDTSSLALTHYQVLLQAESLQSPGDYTTLATATFSLVDRSAPTITINNPVDSGYTSGTATATIYARDELSGVQKVEVRIDGASWSTASIQDAAQSLYGILLPSLPEGTHTLEARATDNYSNVATAGPISFIVDNVSPVITITGVANDGLYNYDVTPNVALSDANLVSSQVFLNGAPYTNGVISQEGNYQLIAQARDAAGNTSQASLWFTIDKTAPVISVTGVEEGGLYNTVVYPQITVTDPYLVTEHVTLNGEPFVSGAAVSTDGAYTLNVDAIDGASNQATTSISFEVDTTPPSAPVVTYPTDGATLNDRLIDVTGTSEAMATVYLVQGSVETAVYADAKGNFVFPHVLFNEGVNTLRLYAKDRAGNIGSSTTISVKILSAELTGEVRSPEGVLVLLPDAETSKASPLQQVIEATFKDNNVDYLLVTNEVEFIKALRSNHYATVLLAELNPSCNTDSSSGCAGQLAHLKLSLSAEQELRASVASGTGLVWIKPDSDANERYSDILGAKLLGILPQPTMLSLDTSPASQAGQWAIGNVALNAQPNTGTAVGQIAPYNAPALVLNKYGAGSVVLVTFDPATIVVQTDAQSIIKNLVYYATPTNQSLLPGGLAEVKFRAAKLHPPLDVVFDESVTSPVEITEAIDGTLKSATLASWERSLVASETSFGSLIQLPLRSGSYDINGVLKEKRDGSILPLISKTVTFNLGLERDEISSGTMETLASLDVTPQYRERLSQAITLVNEAIQMPQSNINDAEKSIALLIDAVNKIQPIPNSAEAIGSVGQLLRIYQLRWSEY